MAFETSRFSTDDVWSSGVVVACDMSHVVQLKLSDAVLSVSCALPAARDVPRVLLSPQARRLPPRHISVRCAIARPDSLRSIPDASAAERIAAAATTSLSFQHSVLSCLSLLSASCILLCQ